MKAKNDSPARRSTIREFAEGIRGLSPNMLELQIAIAVEQLKEDHGINIEPEEFAELVS